jgi:hypothetical protein
MADGCKREARYRVYGPRNSKFGDYCMQHADSKVLELERYEQAFEYANRQRNRR